MEYKGYKFVAAANLFRNYGGLGVYIKYKKNGDNISIKEAGKNHIWYECPDRDIVMVRDGFATESFKPDGFDYYLDLNTFKDQTTKELGLDYVMTNFSHDMDYTSNRGELADKHRKIDILSDSGGLQLVTGTAETIHPMDLINFYNGNVNAGMVLDIPLLVGDEAIVKRAAKLHKRNNDIMLKNAKPGVELINIFHGTTKQQQTYYRETVEDDRITRVAIGGLMRRNPITAVNTIYEIIQGGIRYKQYHALGVFVVPYLALLVKIANSGDNPPHITSDSTSHIQASLNMVYHVQPDESHMMLRRPIGNKDINSTSNPHMKLNCNCPVCAALKYRDILAFGHNRFNGFFALHNAIEMARYSNSIQQAVQTLSPSQYNAYMLQQLKHTRDKHEVKLALDFIDVVTQEGLAKAQKKYSAHLDSWKTKAETPKTLFNHSNNEDDADNEEPEVKGTREQKMDRMLKILSRLEQQIS